MGKREGQPTMASAPTTCLTVYIFARPIPLLSPSSREKFRTCFPASTLKKLTEDCRAKINKEKRIRPQSRGEKK